MVSDKKNSPNILLSILVGIFSCLSIYNIGFLDGFVGDEVRYRDYALEILSGGFHSNLEHPLLSKSIQGLSAGLSAVCNVDSVVGMRMVSLLAALGVVIMTFRIAVKYVSPANAVVGTVLLIVNTLFIVHARLISPEMPAIFFMLLSLYYFIENCTGNRSSTLGISGAFLGLSLSAKWVGIWLFPWMITRLMYKKQYVNVLWYCFAMLLFYILGNVSYFMNHDFLDFFSWHKWMMKYHQITAEVSAYNGSPAWTWFSIPQHLYYARLMPTGDEAMMVMGTLNPIIFVLVIPAVWVAFDRRSPFAIRLLGESFVCLYLPWVFVSRPTYFFYVLTTIPVLSIIEGYLLIKWANKGYIASRWVYMLILSAVILFAIFYPLAVGMRVSGKYEEKLAFFNLYTRPVYDSMFCQKCNLYSNEVVR